MFLLTPTLEGKQPRKSLAGTLTEPFHAYTSVYGNVCMYTHGSLAEAWEHSITFHDSPSLVLKSPYVGKNLRDHLRPESRSLILGLR